MFDNNSNKIFVIRINTNLDFYFQKDLKKDATAVVLPNYWRWRIFSTPWIIDRPTEAEIGQDIRK